MPLLQCLLKSLPQCLLQCLLLPQSLLSLLLNLLHLSRRLQHFQLQNVLQETHRTFGL